MKNFIFLFLFVAATVNAQTNNDSLDLILEKIENLENELARLSNQIDSNTFEVQKLDESNQARYVDLDKRIHELEAIILLSKEEEVVEEKIELNNPLAELIEKDGEEKKDAPKKEIVQNVSKSLVSSLVELHNIDIERANLNDLGNINGYIKRQVEGWIKRYNHSKTDALKNMDFIASWLIENQPLEVKASIVHNDFKYDNLVLNKDDHSKITAILDWEMATIGDPFMDLGTSLGYWVDENDLPELKLFQLSATTLDGNPTREGILELYEHKSGKSIINPVFYYVFGLFKIAVIAQQIYFRYKKGYTKDRRFSLLNLAVMSLSIMAKQAITKNRLSDLFE